MAGRISNYIHSDKSVPNKGGTMVHVSCRTDFVARTDQFVAFADRLAKMAFASGSDDWEAITEAYPDLKQELDDLTKAVKEPIRIERICIMNV